MGCFVVIHTNFWHHFRKMQDITDIFQSFISIEICFFDSCKSKYRCENNPNTMKKLLINKNFSN